MKICAVIPAAGRGSRLNAQMPKLLLPLTENKTVWDILREKLLSIVDHINIIVSPQNEAVIRKAIEPDEKEGMVSLSLQPNPIGMGDAIFCGYDTWSQADTILVVWGDQVFVSQATLSHALKIHSNTHKQVTLPLIKAPQPYVEYIFDDQKKLTTVKQSREGDTCSPNGLADVGTFILSTTDLKTAWEQFINTCALGEQTSEINFLPFLPYLSNHGWQVKSTLVPNIIEARGINTQDDLNFFKKLYAKQEISI